MKKRLNFLILSFATLNLGQAMTIDDIPMQDLSRPQSHTNKKNIMVENSELDIVETKNLRVLADSKGKKTFIKLGQKISRGLQKIGDMFFSCFILDTSYHYNNPGSYYHYGYSYSSYPYSYPYGYPGYPMM